MGFQDRGRALWENRPSFSGFNVAMFDIYQIGRGLTPRRGGNKGTLGVTADQRADTRQELLTPVFRRRAFQRSRGLAPRRPAVWRYIRVGVQVVGPAFRRRVMNS
jgi:hypothetical protein